jgi:hypothetical protein
MRSHRVLADLPLLTEAVAAPDYVADLVRAKAEAEHGLLAVLSSPPAPARIAADVAALQALLDAAEQATTLPDEPGVRAPVNELVVRTRLGSVGAGG